MKITLIGASGFVGTRLIDLLKQNNCELQNIDKQQSRFHSEITAIANVLDKQTLISLLKGTDVVILLAAEHRDDVTPTSFYYDVNVGGMRNTLEAMEANGVKRIIFTSSVAVYGLNKKIQLKHIPLILLIIMGRVNGRRRKCCKSGIRHIRTGILMLFVLQLFSVNEIEGMFIIY